MRRVMCVLAVGLMTLTACGGDNDDSTDSASSAGDVDTTDAPAGDPDGESGEIPDFASDFDRVCTTQVGFAGAAPYTTGTGPHPVMLFEESDGNWYQTGDFPEGWEIAEDTDFEDNSDLAPLELVACAALLEETPTGIECEFEADDGTVTLELVNTTYEVTVYEAATADVVLTATVATDTTDCPFVASITEGDTQELIRPLPDDYTNAVKDAVVPAA